MKIIKVLLTIIFITILAFAGTSCMTSKGSLFDDVASSDSEISTDEEILEEDETTGLTIKTNPSYADIFINNTYAGVSPVTELLNNGNYRIKVELEGYYSTSEWVNYSEGDNVTLNINLEPIIGYLNISVSPVEAAISTGWDDLYQGTNELQIGGHLIEAELFGYKKWEGQVTIFKDRTTPLQIQMEPSEFNISNLFLSRQAFNPSNPAGLGETKINFDVSTYGTGNLKIFSETGELILTNTFPSFENWNQSFVWNGKDNYGTLMPDGIYRVEVSGRDMRGDNLSKKETFVTIDSSLVIRIRTTLNGTSGAMFCPSPDTLPKGSFQLAVNTFGHVEGENYRFPFTAIARIIPYKNMEITGQAGIILLPETSESYYLSGSAKSVILNTKNGDISWYVKGSYQNNHETDNQTNFTGLSFGLPMSLSLLPVTLVVSPEFILSPFRVTYDGSDYDPGFYIWGYGRAAVIFDIGSAMLGLSTAMRITPYKFSISNNNPISAGIELNWLIPGTGIFITGIVSGEYGSSNYYYINAGGGIGLIN
ncbi:MAG: PEGA domain-containing protein [Spirochaetia bacterium]|jgi:hypothetical protein|nr:PEGA domain-containing protein [Spirochaetia bacterium]